MINLNIEPKECFDLSYEAYQNKARSHAALYIKKMGLQELNAPQKILKIYEHTKIITLELQGFRRKDYLNSAGEKTRIYNILFGHGLFDHRDEKPQALESLMLNETNHCLHRLLKETEAELPPFFNADFINGVMNVLFYELDKRPGKTSHKDYFKMRAWQTHKLMECVRMEGGQLRKRFVERYVDSPALIEHLWSVKHQFDELFREARHWTTATFAAKMLKIEVFLPGSLPDDMDEFQRLFCQFLKGARFPYALSPQMLNMAHENIMADKLSPVPICCWSITKFRNWLTDVLEGKVGFRDDKDYDYEALFEPNFERAIVKAQKLNAEFKLRYLTLRVSQKKYKSIILNELNKLRREFNQLEFPEYFKLLLNKEHLKTNFIKDCILNNDTDNRAFGLRKAIEMNERIQFFRSELFQLDEILSEPTIKIGKLKDSFSDFISVMIPSQEISEEIWWTFNNIHIALLRKKPYHFIIKDLNDALYKIFHEALSDFNKMLVRQPGHVIECYRQNLLVELEILALTKPEFSLEIIEPYLKELKKLVKLRLQSRSGQQGSNLANIGILDFNQDIKEGRPDNNIILAFYYDNKKDDNLSLVHKALIHLKAIPEETTVAELREFVNGQKCQHPIPWLAGLGDLMVFIKALANNGKVTFPYQQQWNIAVKCFVKADGSPINVTVLKASRPTNRAAKFIKAANHF